MPLDLFVGRVAALASVAEVLNRVEAGQPWLVALEGDPGLGKTTLARRCLAETDGGGLRVLPAASQTAFDRSRESIFTTDRDPHPRVLGIYGGKLTGWRAAAAHVMERIGPSLTARPRRAATDQLVLRRA